MRAVGKYLTLVIVSVFVVAVALQGSIPQVATGAWQPAEQMNQARTGATAVLLPDGRILIAGGTAPDGTVLSSAEFFNTDGTFFDGASHEHEPIRASSRLDAERRSAGDRRDDHRGHGHELR